jgi:hypothetical protein
MKELLFRMMWFIVGCNVTAISLTYTPRAECTATAAYLWQANAIGLGVIGVLIIALGFWEEWQERKGGKQ